MTEKTYKIRPWNCDKQAFDPDREVTLAQFLAETKAAAERAKAIYASNLAKSCPPRHPSNRVVR